MSTEETAGEPVVGGQAVGGLVADEPVAGGSVLATVAGVVPVVLGLLTLWFAGDLGLGGLRDPGPGLWPTIVAVLLVLTGVVIIVGAGKSTDTEAFTRGTAVVGLGIASLVLYTALFEVIGFEIPTVLLLVLWLRFFGREKWRSTVIVSVVTTAAAYLVFIIGLGVPLPHLIAF